MDKKVKFSDRPLAVKIIYAVVVAILCITAIVVGIVSASKPNDDPAPENPPIENPGENGDNSGGEENKPPEEEKKLAFISPLVGSVALHHDLEAPVYSTTLGEWKVHTGIDIATEAGATVYASEDGTVSAIYSDALYGYTVELTHEGDIKTRYSNLDKNSVTSIKVGEEIKSGDVIGTVGDTAIAELAEEPHLHFEVLLKGVKVNPLDYITEESKKASLGIGK